MNDLLKFPSLRSKSAAIASVARQSITAHLDTGLPRCARNDGIFSMKRCVNNRMFMESIG